MFPAGELGWHGNIPTVGLVLVDPSCIESSSSSAPDHSHMSSFDEVVDGEIEIQNMSKKRYEQGVPMEVPKDMRHRHLDSMSLVQEYGRKDLFFTITCNSNWPEIKDCLAQGEEVQNRPDLVVRVFKAKLSILQDRIMTDKIFGEVASVVHVAEI
ncbi:hypothetical protein LIER_34738 [Lithospermum erythrorhizon]|uniref:Helitron helicase-like domain-containing protein n=1 Tax=Lithospermum erythrorhizon TaxID=34254 RepID=A0AAV3S2P5_LITER